MNYTTMKPSKFVKMKIFGPVRESKASTQRDTHSPRIEFESHHDLKDKCNYFPAHLVAIDRKRKG